MYAKIQYIGKVPLPRTSKTICLFRASASFVTWIRVPSLSFFRRILYPSDFNSAERLSPSASRTYTYSSSITTINYRYYWFSATTTFIRHDYFLVLLQRITFFLRSLSAAACWSIASEMKRSGVISVISYL